MSFRSARWAFASWASWASFASFALAGCSSDAPEDGCPFGHYPLVEHWDFYMGQCGEIVIDCVDGEEVRWERLTPCELFPDAGPPPPPPPSPPRVALRFGVGSTTRASVSAGDPDGHAVRFVLEGSEVRSSDASLDDRAPFERVVALGNPPRFLTLGGVDPEPAVRTETAEWLFAPAGSRVDGVDVDAPSFVRWGLDAPVERVALPDGVELQVAFATEEGLAFFGRAPGTASFDGGATTLGADEAPVTFLGEVTVGGAVSARPVGRAVEIEVAEPFASHSRIAAAVSATGPGATFGDESLSEGSRALLLLDRGTLAVTDRWALSHRPAAIEPDFDEVVVHLPVVEGGLFGDRVIDPIAWSAHSHAEIRVGVIEPAVETVWPYARFEHGALWVPDEVLWDVPSLTPIGPTGEGTTLLVARFETPERALRSITTDAMRLFHRRSPPPTELLFVLAGTLPMAVGLELLLPGSADSEGVVAVEIDPTTREVQRLMRIDPPSTSPRELELSATPLRGTHLLVTMRTPAGGIDIQLVPWWITEPVAVIDDLVVTGEDCSLSADARDPGLLAIDTECAGAHTLFIEGETVGYTSPSSDTVFDVSP